MAIVLQLHYSNITKESNDIQIAIFKTKFILGTKDTKHSKVSGVILKDSEQFKYSVPSVFILYKMHYTL